MIDIADERRSLFIVGLALTMVLERRLIKACDGMATIQIHQREIELCGRYV